MAILLYLFGFGISFVLGEIEVTGFQFKPLDLLGSWVFFLLVALFERDSEAEQIEQDCHQEDVYKRQGRGKSEYGKQSSAYLYFRFGPSTRFTQFSTV